MKISIKKQVLLYSLVGLVIPFRLSASDETLKKSVVKITTSTQNVDFYEPWKPGSQVKLQGCGFVIAGNRILTTAHLINKGVYIEVQKFGETKRYVAKIAQTAQDRDLAVLTVEDDDFFKDAKPVEFGTLPFSGDKLLIFGSDDLSIKEDSVSALSMVWGSEGDRSVPAILTNSAIDGKSEGCPVLSNGKLVGVPFECTGKPDKSGSLIPVNLIQKFLDDIKGGNAYKGFPDLGIYTQDLENSALRSLLKVPAKQTGVIVTKVLYGGSADGILKENDVLTAIDGHPIDNEGYITLRKSDRIDGDYLTAFHSLGDIMDLDILRDGQPLKIKLPLKPLVRLVPYRADNRHPTYFILAGFVFTPLTVNYYQTGKWDSYKPKLQEIYYHGLPSEDRKEVVLISHVLPNEMNKGYDKQTNLVVQKVNGRTIKDMKDLIEAFNHPNGKYHEIDIDEFAWFGSKIIFDADRAEDATKEIMADFRISEDRSRDLK